MRDYIRIGAFFAVLCAGVVVFAWYYFKEIEVTPCSPSGAVIRCYTVNPKVCKFTWALSEKTCKEWLKKFDVAPGRLTGPIIAKCQMSVVDSAFAVSRKSTPECQEGFRELEDWKRRNSPP